MRQIVKALSAACVMVAAMSLLVRRCQRHA